MKVSILLILVIFCVLAFGNPDRTPDCRKFVFAPICRGVAAKRTPPARNGIFLDAHKLRALLKSYTMASDLPEEERVAAPMEVTPIRSTIKKQEADVLPFYDYEHA